MAISPNDTFSAGQVLTATECNQFPRGVIAYSETTTSDATITTTEEGQITSVNFTAFANRYYKITYFEPQLTNAVASNFTARIRKGTLITSPEIQRSITTVSAAGYEPSNTVAVTTFTAGTQNVLVSLQGSAGTGTATRGATFPAFLLIEDIGPA